MLGPQINFSNGLCAIFCVLSIHPGQVDKHNTRPALHVFIILVMLQMVFPFHISWIAICLTGLLVHVSLTRLASRVKSVVMWSTLIKKKPTSGN